MQLTRVFFVYSACLGVIALTPVVALAQVEAPDGGQVQLSPATENSESPSDDGDNAGLRVSDAQARDEDQADGAPSSAGDERRAELGLRAWFGQGYQTDSSQRTEQFGFGFSVMRRLGSSTSSDSDTKQSLVFSPDFTFGFIQEADPDYTNSLRVHLPVAIRLTQKSWTIAPMLYAQIDREFSSSSRVDSTIGGGLGLDYTNSASAPLFGAAITGESTRRNGEAIAREVTPSIRVGHGLPVKSGTTRMNYGLSMSIETLTQIEQTTETAAGFVELVRPIAQGPDQLAFRSQVGRRLGDDAPYQILFRVRYSY